MQKVGVRSHDMQTLVVKTGCDSSTVKHSAVGVRATGSRRWPLYTCHVKYGIFKYPHYETILPWVLSMGQNLNSFPGHGDVFILKKFSSGTKKTQNKQTNKQQADIANHPEINSA